MATSDWFVPRTAEPDRLTPPPGEHPALRLVHLHDWLALCEDRTGLIVGVKDRRLAALGIYSLPARGLKHHESDARRGDFAAGRTLRLVREPANPHDPNAIAVYDHTGRYCAGYINRQKARTLARLIDAGTVLDAISTRGTGPGQPCDKVEILAAPPEMMRHLLSPRPSRIPIAHPAARALAA